MKEKAGIRRNGDWNIKTRSNKRSILFVAYEAGLSVERKSENQ